MDWGAELFRLCDKFPQGLGAELPATFFREPKIG